MSTAAEILAIIEEEEHQDIKQLAKRMDVHPKRLESLLILLCGHDLVEYDSKTGRIQLPKWLLRVNRELEDARPAVGAIILPRNEEIRLQDVTIGNLTKNDLELKIRFGGKLKEIAICDMG